MLVLSRHRDESIVITTPGGERAVVTVVDIRGDKVRLGCTADKSIIFHRAEVQEQVDAEARRKEQDREHPPAA